MSVIERVEMAVRTAREGRCDDPWCKVMPADLEALLKVVRAAQAVIDVTGDDCGVVSCRSLACHLARAMAVLK